MKKSSSKPKKNKSEAALRKQVATLSQQLKDLAPAAYSGRQPSRAQPKVQTTQSCTVVSHKEIMAWPLSSATYTTMGAGVNPGHALAFPWLSIVALAYESYRFRRLRFNYYPRCPTTQAGQLLLLLDPKSGDLSPANVQIASSYHMRSTGPMWKEMSLSIPKNVLDGQGPHRLIRSTEIANGDIRSLYDVGRFIIAQDGGSPASAIVGEVEVEYEVELYTPSLSPAGNVPSGWVNGSGVFSTSNIFGTTRVFGGLLVVASSGNDVFIDNMVHTNSPLGGLAVNTLYEILVYITGTAITAVSATNLNSTGPGGSNAIQNVLVVINGAANSAMYRARLSVGISDDVLTFAVTATTITDAVMSISRLSNDISW